MTFAQEITAAIASLGLAEGAPVVDGSADPGALCAALGEDGIVLRAGPELGAASEAFGPSPRDPVWLGLRKGSPEVASVPLRGGQRGSSRAVRVEVEVRDEACCDAPACAQERHLASAWLVVAADGGATARWLVSEQRSLADAGLTAARAVAAQLAEYLGVPCEGGARESAPAPLGASVAPAELGRFALQNEGDRWVLRDHGSVGPRATARRNTVIGALLLGVAAAAGAVGARFYQAGTIDGAIGAGATFALFALAGYAFLGVARFASRYAARSTPIFLVGRDRMVVLPWVSREGAIDLRPEGRLGAAIPLGEVRAATVQSRGDLFGVEIDTEHGPMDALATDHEGVARLWAAALTRAIDEARHPVAVASARQRARRRGKEDGAPAKV